MSRAVAPARRERRRLRVTGTVQGVGFRPAVHRLAARHGLAGFVRNDGWGVTIEAEGEPAALDAFVRALPAQAPPRAVLDSLGVEAIPATGAGGFAVAASDPAAAAAPALVPPDAVTCAACRGELLDAADRRHRYPFTTCADCGPRYTITRAVPFDRERTAMAAFPMCRACRAEYDDPADRRFHAETISCPACGPRLSMALADAAGLLRDGGILAVKGLGGWHLACDATSEAAVRRLRARKRRDEKPFALLCLEPGEVAEPTAREAALLGSPAGPIVLVRRRADAPVATAVAPGSPWLGVMRPPTPLHLLLCADAGRPLVLTSGNRAHEPIAVGDAEARERLGEIADAFLGHDRAIERRCEDGVVRAAFPIRRSRGEVPAPLPLPVPAPRPLVAAGAELKATFCVARGAEAFPSPHLGDHDHPEARRAFVRDLDLYLAMLGVRAEAVACDLHPGYAATAWAHDQDAELVEVQHHHAHAAACLAEHDEAGEALALVLDGTGLGTDGTLWGGELLRCDLLGFERLAHLAPVPLPGGEAAIREPWRMAAAYLEAAGRPVPFPRWAQVRAALRVNAPPSSGAGRLFDAVAAVLGLRERTSYEGQAAIELERLAGEVPAAPYPCALAGGLIRGADLVAAAHDDLAAGRPRAEIAAAFHEGLARALAAACAHAGAPRTVALSGGTFQNLRLLASVHRRLAAEGFTVLAHRRVPPNDAGIAYGQAAVAAARLRAGAPAGAGERRAA